MTTPRTKRLCQGCGRDFWPITSLETEGCDGDCGFNILGWQLGGISVGDRPPDPPYRVDNVFSIHSGRYRANNGIRAIL